jgi:hypothetical protein
VPLPVLGAGDAAPDAWGTKHLRVADDPEQWLGYDVELVGCRPPQWASIVLVVQVAPILNTCKMRQWPSFLGICNA